MNDSSAREMETSEQRQPSIVGIVTNNYLTKSTGAFRQRKKTVETDIKIRRKSKRRQLSTLMNEDPLE
jgi:hypothetical protein